MVHGNVARRELDYHGNACLPQRRPFASCQSCQDVCPVSAVALAASQFGIGESCQACGRCAAACPTGALAIANVEPPAGWRATGPVHLECHRVPAGRGADPEIRLPCLGALGAETLLAWVLAAKGQPVILVDRGWCAGCPVGSGAVSHPAQAALDHVNALMAAMGLKAGLAPRLETRPLDSKFRDDRSSRDVPSRRDLLRGLGSRARQPASTGSLAKRHRVTERLAALARRHGAVLPAIHFPALALDEACALHGVCAAVCPTGALRLDSEQNVKRLGFDAADCLGCGRCAAQCPEAALAMQPNGNGAVPEGRIELGRRIVSICSGCGQDYVAAEPRTICPACQRRNQLGRLGLGLAQAARPSQPNVNTESLS